MTTARPVLHRPSGGATVAVQHLIDTLQRGFDTGDADIYDGMFADDLLWGTPKGLGLAGYDVLNPIHQRMMGGRPVKPESAIRARHSSSSRVRELWLLRSAGLH